MSAKILSLKLWHPAKYEVRDNDELLGTIKYEVKRLRQDEAVEFNAATVRAFAELDRAQEHVQALGPDPTRQQKGEAFVFASEAQKRFFQELTPELTKTIFTKWIRNVSGVEVEGKAITTGEELYEVADESFVLAAIVEIRSASSLRAIEGKGFGRRSTSASATDAGGSDVPSTGSADGAEPSTATPTPSAPASSGDPAPVPMVASPG